MKFRLVTRDGSIPSAARDTAYLWIDHWNDYSFVTMFYLKVYDHDGNSYDIGQTKIGFKGQTISETTYSKIGVEFDSLHDDFFSVGQDVEFYKNVNSLPSGMGLEILTAIRDIALTPSIISDVEEEPVFGTSLLRSVSLSVIKGQFARILEGRAELTDFRFDFIRPEVDGFDEVHLEFRVHAQSTPSTNIHAVIGRNGVGKTTLLNSMIEAIMSPGPGPRFVDTSSWEREVIPADYFSGLVSVSFSAFDPFSPPIEQPDPAKGACYFYIGLKDPGDSERNRTITDLRQDCTRALLECFYSDPKTDRWLAAIDKLGSDEIFASMELRVLLEIYRRMRRQRANQSDSQDKGFASAYFAEISHYLERMSSGHAVVLLTITRLVAAVEEKTLVLLDEPESHLHPPLLSAFLRALSDLLHDRNGVAIIATHSPVVLQEVPRSCVWKIYRAGTSVSADRPSLETFAENVGMLTSEVFGLEVERSGFHAVLARSVATGRTYDQILSDYGLQLGLEGRSVLSALIASRDAGERHAEIE